MTKYTITVTADSITIDPEIDGVEIEAHLYYDEWVCGDGYQSKHVDTIHAAVEEVQDAIGYYAEGDYEIEVIDETTQEEETDMNDFDPYAQDRQDGEAQEKREDAIFNSIDTGAGPRLTLAQIDAAIAADDAETVYVRDWGMDTPQSNGEAFVLTNRPDGLRWVADRANGGIAIGRYNDVGYGPELPAGYDWRPVEVASLRWYAVDDE